MNIRAAGEVKAKTLFEALDLAATIDQKAAAYNSNVTLVVFYADTKKKIADTKFVATIFQEEPLEYCYDTDGDGIDAAQSKSA